jgi:hypothetical protein
MQSITTIGLDLAKSVFQIHGVDGNGAIVVRRALRRFSTSSAGFHLAWSGWKPAQVRITGRARLPPSDMTPE